MPQGYELSPELRRPHRQMGQMNYSPARHGGYVGSTTISDTSSDMNCEVTTDG